MFQRALVLLVLGAAPALAQIVPEPVFTGNESEPFAGPNFGFQPCIPQRAFNNKADFCTPNGSLAHLTSGWGYFCTIPNYSPPYFYGAAGGVTEITFDQPVSRFGGYFGTNSGAPDATIEFFDANGALLHSEVTAIPNDCTWSWRGWRVAGGAPISKITVLGLNSNGGHIMMDDLEADFGSAPPVGPVVYCTAGTSTNGCVPSLTASGQPSATQATPCILTVDDVEGQKSGLVFYGIDNTGFTPLPWHPNSTSFFCVKGPVQRTPAQSSGGTLNGCDGQLSLDWDNFHAAFPGSLGAPFSVGDKAYAQAWYRDPPAPRTTNLSDAVELTVAP